MKRQRQAKILEVVGDKELHDQKDIAEELSRYGFEVTQSTISRDIKELGLVKVRDESGTPCYRPPGEDMPSNRLGQLKRLAKEVMLSAETSENLLVIKTYPGNAQGLAAALDHSEVKGIVGTVAGDDTIMAVCLDREEGETIKDLLLSMVRAA